jgi:AraC-like DNA-binding protein
MLRRSLPSDLRWTPAPHVRSLRSHSSQAQVAEALREACEVPPVQVDAAVYTDDAANVPALYADLDYGALLVLVVDVERLALGARRRPSADTLLVSDLAGWDWVVLLGPEDQLLASSLHIDARLAGRISCVVRTEHVVRQLVTQLQCLAFRAPIGFGPNAPWLPAGYPALDALPARLVLALRRLRAQRADASVKQLAFLAGISRRQLERHFDTAGLGSPADFVAMLVATDR